MYFFLKQHLYSAYTFVSFYQNFFSEFNMEKFYTNHIKEKLR